MFPKTSHHDNPQCSTVAQSENQLDSPHVTDSENYQHNQGNDSNEERCDENDNNVKKLDDKEEEESKKLEWVTVSSDKESISDPSEWFALTDTKIIFGSSFDIARCDEDRPAKRRRLNVRSHHSISLHAQHLFFLLSFSNKLANLLMSMNLRGCY